MKVKLINHASIIIETEDAKIWTDPWLFGTAFNDSWKLFPKPEFDEALYDEINFVWVSHEHPDHFHVPTLRALPKEFKEKVTLLFQNNNSDKMPNAFRKFGFKNIILLENREVTQITEKTKVHNYQVGQMDSSLAVLSDGKVVLNVNDCELTKNDAKVYKKDLGKIDIALNQFSMAGYNGYFNYDEYLPKRAETVLDTMIINHRDLDAGITIPIASFVYFCKQDNKFMNAYGNTPKKVRQKFLDEGLECRFLNVNQVIDLNNIEAHDKEGSFETLSALYDNRESLYEYDALESVEYDDVKAAFNERYEQLKKNHSWLFLRKLKLVKIFMPDLNKTVNLSLYTGQFEDYTGDDFDLQINSQPLFFAFKFTWGLQTLGVSARYLIKDNFKTWKWYKIITSLNNAQVFLKARYFFKAKNMSYLFSRVNQLPGQIKHRLARMRS